MTAKAGPQNYMTRHLDSPSHFRRTVSNAASIDWLENPFCQETWASSASLTLHRLYLLICDLYTGNAL
jgi:hypothetical protein